MYRLDKMEEGQNISDAESELAQGQNSPVGPVDVENNTGNSQNEIDNAADIQNVKGSNNPNSEILNFMKIMIDQLRSDIRTEFNQNSEN